MKKTFKLKESNSVKEWESLYKVMDGVKTSTGVRLQDEMKEFQRALMVVALKPSQIKEYLNADYNIPEKDKINKLIDIITSMDLLKAKFK